MAMSKATPQKTNTNLQALRLVFVMFIFMSHFSYRGVASFEAGGDCGVAFFFLLSGFVLSLGYGDSISNGTFNVKRYVKRRLLKVYPLHLVCLLVFLVLFRPDINQRLPLNMLLLQSWVPDDSYYFSYNGVSWFLSSLLFSYLVFPVVYRYANRWTLAAVLVGYLVVYFVVPYEQINALLYVFPPVRFVDFFLGIMLYKVYSCRQQQSTQQPTWTEPLLLVLLVLAVMAYPYADEKLRNAPLYWLVLIPIIYVFMRQQGPVSRCLQSPVVQWLSQLSMPIFMLHPIVFRCMFHFFPSLPYAVMLLACIALTVAASWGVERLLLRKIE